MSDRDDAPSWWKSQGNLSLNDAAGRTLEDAMREMYNRCTRGPEPVEPEKAPMTKDELIASINRAADQIDEACKRSALDEFPQDQSAASSVLGDICPRCGTTLEQHEGLERDYPSCPACR